MTLRRPPVAMLLLAALFASIIGSSWGDEASLSVEQASIVARGSELRLAHGLTLTGGALKIVADPASGRLSIGAVTLYPVGDDPPTVKELTSVGAYGADGDGVEIGGVGVGYNTIYASTGDLTLAAETGIVLDGPVTLGSFNTVSGFYLSGPLPPDPNGGYTGPMPLAGEETCISAHGTASCDAHPACGNGVPTTRLDIFPCRLGKQDVIENCELVLCGVGE